MDEGARACQALDQAVIEAALVKAGGSIKTAATALGVSQSALRRRVRATPGLIDAVFEIEEQRLDAVEATIARSIRRGPLSTRIIAAQALLTLTGKLR